MSELKLDQNQAVSILIALINQGKIELPCLKEFNKFREWELSQSRPTAADLIRYSVTTLTSIETPFVDKRQPLMRNISKLS